MACKVVGDLSVIGASFVKKLLLDQYLSGFFKFNHKALKTELTLSSDLQSCLIYVMLLKLFMALING